MNHFERGDRVRITTGEAKGRVGIINYVISPHLQNPQCGYLVELDGKLPWFAEFELEMAKEQVVFT